MRLPKGSSLVFQMHYTTIGKETTDRTKMGFIFAKEAPKIPLTGTALANGGLHIPAGAADHRVDAEMTINRDLLLYSMTPHTHVRGKKWYYEVIYPDGRREALLSVPNYDFEWQHEYQFSRAEASCRRARRSTPRRGTTTRRPTSRTPIRPRTCGGAIRRGKR